MPHTLRSRTIRLAYSNPALRPYLLPLLVRTADDKSFEEAVKGKKFRNPETGNDVAFSSLPSEEQKKVRESWSKKNEGKAEEKGGGKSVEVAQKELAGATKAHEDHQSSKSEEVRIPYSGEESAGEMRDIFSRFATGNDAAEFKKQFSALYKMGNGDHSFTTFEVEDLKNVVKDVKADIEKFKKYVQRESGQLSPSKKAEYDRVADNLFQNLNESVKKALAWEEKDKKLSESVDSAKSALSEAKKPKKEETPAEIKEKAEEFAKNIKDPEEREKAIKRLKKMSPAEMKAMMASAGNDEEGGKKAFFRSRVIRLAHQNPALRPYLLPLLSK